MMDYRSSDRDPRSDYVGREEKASAARLGFVDETSAPPVSPGTRTVTDAEYIQDRTALACDRLEALLERIRGPIPQAAGDAKGVPSGSGYFGYLANRHEVARSNIARLLLQIEELEGLFT